jgi:hypothetical protein
LVLSLQESSGVALYRDLVGLAITFISNAVKSPPRIRKASSAARVEAAKEAGGAAALLVLASSRS